MNINHILLLVAVLNLSADLYNVIRFKERLPGWILWANLSALAICGVAWIVHPAIAGYIGLGALLTYVIAVNTSARRWAPSPSLPSPATKLLIMANVVVFAIQIARGATNNALGFIDLGAVYTPLLEEGEWWRIFTAQFLHWGALHLVFNMMGLWLLGRSAEALFGAWRYIGLYLFSGAGGMLIAWEFSKLGGDSHPIILVGASASVLGLVGAQAAVSLLAYRYTGSIAAKAQLSSMTQIVFMQAIFDMMVPEVSSTAHVGGAAAGFCLTYGVLGYALKRRAAKS